MSTATPQSISDRIRELAAAGYSRADIARMVDRSYQQVRQVLVGDEARARRYDLPQAPSQPAQVSERGAIYRHESASMIGDIARIPIAADGSALLPAEVVARLTGGQGHILIGRFVEDALWMLGPVAAAAKAKEGLPAWRPGEPMWSDMLIAERRAEAARELEDD